MQKLNVIFLILCIPLLQQITARRHHQPPLAFYEQFKINYTARDRINYTQEVDYLTPNGYKTYTLSKNDTHVFVNTTDDRNFTSFKCVMPYKGLNNGFQATTNNDGTIILWNLQTESFNVVGVTLLLLDPRFCNITSLNVPADVIPENYPPYKPQVLTYSSKDYFDIFYGGRQFCMPCRFTNKGERKDMADNQVKNITSQLARPYLIRRYLEANTNISYLLIHSYYDHDLLQTAVDKLDENFKAVVNRTFVHHFIDAAAISQRGIEVCYKVEYQKKIQETEVYCDHYLSDFTRDRHVKLDIPRYEYVDGITISVTDSGSLCVAVPHISYVNRGNNYTLSFTRVSHWVSRDRYTPTTITIPNHDDENGYHLKTRNLRQFRQRCD